MYDIQNRLPAPYAMNKFGPTSMGQSQFGSLAPDSINPMTMSPALKRGGRAKTRGMTTVHMNPHEISIMEHLQGHTRYNKDGVKEFHHLEELLKNPHILRSAHHHASGGSTHDEMEHLREGGRFGDTALAAIGPHTQNFFDQLSGHPSTNPYTGHPEYFNLGGALGGLLGALKGGLGGALQFGKTVGQSALNAGRAAAPHLKELTKQALPSLLPVAQEALGNKFGAMGNMAGQALGNAATHALGPQEGPVNPYHQAFGQAFGRGVESYRGGASPSQAFGQGLETAGSHLGGGIGGAMEGMGRSIGAGNNVRNTLRSGAQSGFNALGGRQGLADMASTVAQGFGNGGMGGAQDAARQQFNDYRQRAMPQFQEPANGYYGNQYPGYMEQYQR